MKTVKKESSPKIRVFSQSVVRMIEQPDHPLNRGVVGRVRANGLLIDILEPDAIKSPWPSVAWVPNGTFYLLDLDTGQAKDVVFRALRAHMRDTKTGPVRHLTREHMLRDLHEERHLLDLVKQPGVVASYGRVGFSEISNIGTAELHCVDCVLRPAPSLEDMQGRIKQLYIHSGYGQVQIESATRQFVPKEKNGEDWEFITGCSTLRARMLVESIGFATTPVGTRGYWAGRIAATPLHYELAGRGGAVIYDGHVLNHGMPITGKVKLFGKDQIFGFWHASPHIDLNHVLRPETLEKDLLERLDFQYPFIRQMGLIGPMQFDLPPT